MVRSILSKVMWVGRITSTVIGLAVALALVVGVTTTALAAVPGDPFRLGQTNGIDAMSTLVGNVAGPMLRLDNNSTGTRATALDLHVETGKPPMKVNSGTKVAKLNADWLDGLDSTGFYAAGSKVADSSHADQADSATNAQSAANADRLDGKDTTDLLPGGTLPAGTTIRGTYEYDGHATFGGQLVGGDSISFVYTLPSAPAPIFIPQGATPPTQCPGTVDSPQAQPGYLCVYELIHPNMNTGSLYNVSRYGAAVYGTSATAGLAYSGGRWAVTVPNAAQLSSLQKDSSAATTQRPEP